MRPTISQLRSWNLDELREASASLSRRVDEFDDLMDGVGRAAQDVGQTWQGSAATSARERLDLEVRSGIRVTAAGNVLAEALNDGIIAIEGPRSAVLNAVAGIESLGGSVSEDGVLVGDALNVVLADLSAAAVRTGLDQIDAADSALAARLANALAELATAAELRPAGDAGSPWQGPIPEDPAGLSALWASLSDAEKAALLTERPELGSRAGMPAATRDFYNREKLEGLITDTNATLDHLRDPATAMDPGVRGRSIESARTELANFESAATQLAGDPRAMLLDIDRRGLGAIAINNPDTATNVTTLVPGTGTNLRGIGNDVDRSKRLLEAAEDTDPGKSFSVITWAGYESPPDLQEAMDPAYAERGKEALREFQAGLAASHEIGDPYSVVIAHSYGTGTTALAASGGGVLNADALVFLGSPGAMVDNVGELSLTGVAPSEIGEHVYSSKAANDPVPLYSNMGGVFDSVLDAAGFGLGPLAVPLDLVGDVVEDQVSGPYGTDPTDRERFGARVFTSDPGTGTPVFRWNTDAHSEYFDMDGDKPNRSLSNLGLIMAGRGDHVS